MMVTCGMLDLENGFLVIETLPCHSEVSQVQTQKDGEDKCQNLSLLLALRYYRQLFFVGFIVLKNGLSVTEA